MGLIQRAQPTSSLALFRNHPRIPINGVGRLPLPLTINSIEVKPEYVYCAGGGMADATEWRPYKYGNVLPIVNAGTDVTPNAGSPYLGELDDSVKFNAFDYYQYGSNAFGDVAEEDFVIEFIVKRTGIGAMQAALTHRINAADEGYQIDFQVNGTIRGFIEDGGATNRSTYTAAITVGQWLHAMIFFRRSGFAQWYVDGVTSGAAVDISGVGSITAAGPLTIGNNATGSAPYARNICWVAMWKQDDWLDTHLQATVARSRANLVQGVTPYMARGTALPIVQTRASLAYLDKIEKYGTKRIYLMGSGALRLVDRVGKNGKRLRGYLPEVQITNLIPRSQEIDHVSWTKTRCSITNTSTTTLPNGDTSVNDVIHEDGTAANTHFMTSPTINFTSGIKYVYSFYAKEINRGWVAVTMVNNGVTIHAYFNITDGSVGASTFDSIGMIPLKDGTFRCWAAWEHDATEARVARVYVAEGDGDDTFNGLNQDSLYCWGIQIEAGVDKPSSYMPTGAAAVIREEDVLRFNAADGNIGGVGSNRALDFRCRVLMGDVDSTFADTIFTLTDGGSTANRILMYRAAGQDYPRIISAATGGDAGSSIATTDISDGVVHPIRTSLQTDSMKIYVDGGQEGATDTNVDPPVEQDWLDIGQQQNSTAQLNDVIADVNFYERVLREPDAAA